MVVILIHHVPILFLSSGTLTSLTTPYRLLRVGSMELKADKCRNLRQSSLGQVCVFSNRVRRGAGADSCISPVKLAAQIFGGYFSLFAMKHLTVKFAVAGL